jgi:hypothetical protein
MSNVSDIFVLFFSLAIDQAREAEIELLFNSQGVEVSPSEGLALLPASRLVRERRQVFT